MQLTKVRGGYVPARAQADSGAARAILLPLICYEVVFPG